MKKAGYPNIIDQEALNRVNVIASWEEFYQTLKHDLLKAIQKIWIMPGSWLHHS